MMHILSHTHVCVPTCFSHLHIPMFQDLLNYAKWRFDCPQADSIDMKTITVIAKVYLVDLVLV